MRYKPCAAGPGLGPRPEFGCLPSVRTGNLLSQRRVTRRAAGLSFLPVLMFLTAVALSGCAGGPDAPPVATVQPGPLATACSNGVVVRKPEDNQGLVGDCVTLLEAWDTMGGDGKLAWSPELPIDKWIGVTVDGKPKRVRRLEIFGLQLIGKIPENVGKLTALEHLDLSINALNREIPAELGDLTNLVFLDLHINNLTGQIPASLGRLQKLEKLYLEGNELTGCIPQSLQNIPENDLDQLPLKVCEDLPAGQTAVSPAPQPESVTPCSNGTAVPEPFYDPQLIIDCSALLEGRDTLAGNGELDWDPGRPITQWEGVNVDRRNGRLQVLELPQRRLTGQIPPELGQLVNLVMLVLQENELTGEVPGELGQLENLVVLLLSDNPLTGPIPAELGDLSRLQTLDLSVTGVTGEIPSELGDMSSLDRLNLGDNQLSGMVPPELARLSNLGNLDLSGNRLSGTIPPELGDMAALSGLNLSGNQLTGTIPAELGRLPNLRRLDLEGNKLNGEIPPELGEIEGLRQLILQNNELTGEIPEGLKRASGLTKLDLSGNGLSGEIPDWLTGLSGLTLLHLEGNGFTGCVPADLFDIFENDLDRLGLSPC